MDEIRTVLGEGGGGLRPSVVGQSHRVLVQAFYRRRTPVNNHSGMIVVQLRYLELDHLRPRQMVADRSLDRPTVKIASSKILN